jgi:hypothetical protein
MSGRTDRDRVDGNGGGSLGSDDTMVERGFDRWLNRQLHRLYDQVLAEPVPDDLLRLVDQFEPKPPPAQSADEEDGDR